MENQISEVPSHRFEQAYTDTEKPPPWDIGRPQQTFVSLFQAGKIKGRILDVGCGTGENALYLAQQGHEVWGIDKVTSAIVLAKTKAADRKLQATFLVADALYLGSLDNTFDTIIDSGLFHVFSDTDRIRFRESLACVIQPGGTYYMLCFNEFEPYDKGPRRLSQAEIRAVFQTGWRVASIEEVRFETRFHDQGARAWLAGIVRGDE